MRILKGKAVCSGIAFGKTAVYKREQSVVKRYHVQDVDSEINRFETAKSTAYVELGNLYEKALTEVGEENAMIFQIHQMMVEDMDYIESIHGIIKDQSLNAETAVAMTADNFSQMFSSMDDAYMRERAADVNDVSERIINILQKSSTSSIDTSKPVIIIADDLAPSETVQMDKNMILGFATERGSTNSHTSILARTMNIPAIIGTQGIFSEEFDDKDAIIDGFTGTIYIEPDEETIRVMTDKKSELDKQKQLLKTLKGKKTVSLDGQNMNLYANIGNSTDLPKVLQNDAQGIGLFRSEFIYLESSDYPTEDTQFLIYKDVLEKMSGKKVIIRTLDIGADKQVDYFDMPKEENPALGVRAIRICFEKPDVFKTQLRALYRASIYGQLGIMFPMIVSVEEVRKIKDLISQIKKELDNEGIKYSDNVEIGIMIETPASVIISDLLAKEVDFFSVGTNDLTQYTLAMDRQNEVLANMCDTHHRAILRMIKTAADNIHKEGKWIGICGELGADMELTELFLAIGIDELSVSPGCILPLRKKILETDVSKIKEEVLKKYL